jgi:hypothetical protein
MGFRAQGVDLTSLSVLSKTDLCDQLLHFAGNDSFKGALKNDF